MGNKIALTKGDMLIIALVLLATLAGFFMLAAGRQADAAGLSVKIYVDGQLQEAVALAAEEREIRLENNGGYNVLRYSSEGIYMLAADCHNQDCIRTGTQSQPGSMIACLPHHVLVRLSNTGTEGVDAIAY